MRELEQQIFAVGSSDISCPEHPESLCTMPLATQSILLTTSETVEMAVRALQAVLGRGDHRPARRSCQAGCPARAWATAVVSLGILSLFHSNITIRNY